MRIIASKQHAFGSKTFVVLSCKEIHLVETLRGVQPRTLKSPEIVFRQTFNSFDGHLLHKPEHAYTRRDLWRCASGARRAMRMHR